MPGLHRVRDFGTAALPRAPTPRLVLILAFSAAPVQVWPRAPAGLLLGIGYSRCASAGSLLHATLALSVVLQTVVSAGSTSGKDSHHQAEGPGATGHAEYPSW